MKALKLFFLAGLMVGLLSCGDDDTEAGGGPNIEAPEGYTLVWSDEFDGDEINSSNWNYQTGDGTDYGLPAGWGNGELQIYTTNEANANIGSDEGNSVLRITALEEGPDNYTSARLTTENKVSVRYGRVDVRARLPQGKGLWPAIWMLGDNIDQIDWPGCGEIDIMEVLGNLPEISYHTVHYTDGDNRKGDEQAIFNLPSSNFSNEYHVFSLDWNPDEVIFLVDDVVVGQIPIEDDMKEFQRGHFFILNVAVGGFWPGFPDDTTPFPQTMYVDYVRVFSKDDLTIPNEPPLDLAEEFLGQFIPPGTGETAIRDDFTDFGDLTVIAFGGGGEPLVDVSTTAIDGAESLQFDYLGGAWGGAYILLDDATDLSGYSSLKFSLNMPAELVDAEVKLESASTNAPIFLRDYTAVDAGNGFMEYTIPLTDFTGLDLTAVTIPFALWNPLDDSEEFVDGIVLIDNVHFAN